MADRMTCPRCRRPGLAVRNVRGPRVQAGKPIPAIRVPVPHNTLDPVSGEPTRTRCDYGQKRGRSR